MTWISVNERVPDRGLIVMVIYKGYPLYAQYEDAGKFLYAHRISCFQTIVPPKMPEVAELIEPSHWLDIPLFPPEVNYERKRT